jgi:hypothetical protein
MGKTIVKGRDVIVSAPVAVDLLRPPKDSGKEGLTVHDAREAFRNYAQDVRTALAGSAERRAKKAAGGR